MSFFRDGRRAQRCGRIKPSSRHGRRLAYESNETGRVEIYLQAFPDGGDRVQVSTKGGRFARWSRDGKELYFREGDKMMAVSLQGSVVGRPMALFEKRFQGYDVATDGRFLAALPDEKAPPAPVNVVLNWTEELKARVPTK